MKYDNYTVDNTLVMHPLFVTAISQYKQAIGALGSMQSSTGYALTGDSGTGKTTLVKHLKSLYPDTRNEDGLIQPVIYCSVPAHPTLKGLATSLLTAMNVPEVNILQKRGRNSENDLTIQCVRLIKECQTKAIVFDESQHLTRNPGRDGTYAATTWLKRLMSEAKVVMILAGISSTTLLFEQDEQLARRFWSTINLSRFDWTISQSRSEFLGILDAFQSSLPQYEFLPLATTETGFRIFMATGGLLGYLAKLLNQVILDANSDNRKVIKLKHFEISFEKTMRVSSTDAAENPFTETFSTLPTHKTVANAKKVGTSLPAPRTRKVVKRAAYV